VISPLGRRRKLYGMNGWLLWGLVLPVLLVVAGIVQMQRNKRR
jgi:cytochrome c-type biogenesis protein CcmH/NrfF